MHSEKNRASGHKLQQDEFSSDIGEKKCENTDVVEQFGQRGIEIRVPSHETEPSAT